MNKNILFLIILSLLFVDVATAQVGKTQTLFVSVAYNEDGTATISWPKDNSFGGTYQVYKNNSAMNQTLEYTAYVDSVTYEWTDMTYQDGAVKEYAVFKVNKQNQLVSYDFVTLGNRVEQPNLMGGILLLIDGTYKLPLTEEINQLSEDLTREGWTVYTQYVNRELTTLEVKNIVKAKYNESNSTLKTLYLIGHVPVPYSGHFSSNGAAPPPDGHVEGSGNHTGAWPADLYYGDIDGLWTDVTVNYTESKQDRNNNRPEDGKFDQTIIPSLVDLEVGRVDFYDMPAFSDSDTVLLKKYLDKAHRWRTGQLETVNRGLIDDNFKGLQISNTGYKTINYILGLDSLFEDRDYLTELRAGEYLFSFGMGAGSYSSCSGIGNTNDFASENINAIFTGIAGSYFGDWDSKNNILRAALASGALASFWGGIPNWYLQPMAVGKTIGFCTRYSQNASFSSFNYSQQKIHIALMGDPTLKLNPLPPTNDINATETSEGIKLDWAESNGNIDGYNLYRINQEDGSSSKVNNEIITTNEYTDIAAPTGKFKYQVRTVKESLWANNDYFALGQSSTSDEVNFISSVDFSLNDSFTIAPNPSTGTFRMQLGEGEYANSIRIQDLTGNVVYESEGNIHPNQTVQTSLNSGTYVLIANTNKGQFVEKIQIMR